ncbi:MAG TPA: hypothetical protein VHP34_11060 [Alphaproteobacteria bacterium]|nr:hypothetical protein [Alphaproteobacteria bacterium]
MTPAGVRQRVNVMLALCCAATLFLWLGSSHMQAKWSGVPPVPSYNGAVMMTLGDRQFSYRFGAITLQNLGNTGGNVVAVKDYDYQKLGAWFALLHDLDPASNHVPMMAAYYFGATPNKEDLTIVVDYLSTVGQIPVGNKWRWLAQAVFLARHRMQDLDRALDYAYKLSKMDPIGDTLPIWARQMPAFVLSEQGEKESSRKIVEDILLTADDLHPNEVNFMAAYLHEQLDVPQNEVQRILNMRRVSVDNDETRRKPTLPAPMPE